MKRIFAAFVVILAAAHFGTAAGDTTLAIAGRANLAPWIASSGTHVAVAWGAAGEGSKTGDVFVAMSSDSGGTFGRPVRVNAAPGEARVSGEIAPRVALSTTAGQRVPLVTVTWNARGATTQIKTARSRDGGRTFADEKTVQPAGVVGDRGWQAATLDQRSTLHIIWLDHRVMTADKPAGSQAGHKGEHDGVAIAQKSGLYYAADGGVERELFKGVCYCCKTALATGPTGEIYGAWRHVFAGNMRDMAFTVSRDGGRTFSPLVRVNQDGWSINGCPDDGPAMAVDRRGIVHLVWPTVKDERGVILYATSRDGSSFGTPVLVPTLGGPKASHPQIAIDASGRAVIAWDEAIDGRRPAYVVASGGANGNVTFGRAQAIADTSAAVYPSLAATSSGVIAAWTSGAPNQTVIKVRRLE